MAKIMMSNGKEIEFKTVKDAEKYAAFDETCWPCDIVAGDGTVVAHFE